MTPRTRPALPAGPYLVVGLARSGTAAAIALREMGETVLGSDAGTPRGAEIDALARAGVELHVGEQGTELLERVRVLVKSPGVPREAPVIAAALARGTPVLGELELGWRMLENEVIAVTGTNGKTTTVEWIGHIHRTAGMPVAVAGNVGVALSGLVGRVAAETTVVCEASSFQLEDASGFAPEAAVLLNIEPDHLDRHVTFAAYRDAKLAIFARQSPGDVAVVPANLGLAPPGRARSVVSFGELPDQPGAPQGGPGSASMTLSKGALCWQGRSLLRVGEIGLRGRHNACNAMAAAAVCLARGMDRDAVSEGLRTFRGVAHRLEEVAHREGVAYVNDSKATNVASALVALASFRAGTVHLIAGGQGKGQDFAPLREGVERRCRAAYLIGEDAPIIAAALAGLDLPVRECVKLERALQAAIGAAGPGEVILLSPACASFDQFEDYEARGERFRELVAG